MMRYLAIGGGCFLGCVAATRLGLSAWGALVFALPIAAYTVQGRVGLALGLAGMAAWAGFLSEGTVYAAARCALLAGAGVPLGLGIRRQWTYGWTVTAVAALAYAVLAGAAVLAWDDWMNYGARVHGALVAQLRQAGGADDDERIAAAIRNLVWLRDRWGEVSLGLLLWPVLIAASLAASTAAWWRRRRGAPALRGTFRTMRTSEWLVWAAIAVAMAWFIERRWPDDALRTVSWNAAVALASVYWLNGCSILMYALDALRPHALLYVPILVTLIWLGVHPALCCVGLFDTWGDFRRVVDRAAAKRPQTPPARGG